MSNAGERKCALLLLSLRKRDRRRLLAQLPEGPATTIRALMVELAALPLPVEQLANELLSDELRGLTEHTSLSLEQLVALSRRLPPAWFARVVSVFAGLDRNFCLAVMDEGVATASRAELGRMPVLAPKMVEALRAEAMDLAKDTPAVVEDAA